MMGAGAPERPVRLWEGGDGIKDIILGAGKKRWFNFYNPQFVDDQDGDGVQDILIANGGDIAVAPYDSNRRAGCLIKLKTWFRCSS